MNYYSLYNMNILIDLIPFQYRGGIGGAASFAKAVYDRLLSESSGKDIHIYGAYDSTLPIGKQYNYRQYASQHNIILLDISSDSIASLIQREKIGVFFIAMGHFYASYDLSGITCKTIMFIHDIFDVERTDTRVDLVLHDKVAEPAWRWAKRCANLFIGRWEKMNRSLYDHIMPLYTAPTTQAYTVSDYTRNALKYYFPQIQKEIKVCYAPLKHSTPNDTISNPELQQLVSSGKPYLLLLAANRRYKNPKLTTHVFKRLLMDYPDLHLLTLKYGHTIHPQHRDIPFLTDSDLEHAYQQAQALIFPSFFEGFGYPPIEAMRYGTPVIVSHVTSIPEILGDAAVYFSPFYPADLYRAIMMVLSDRNCRKEQMKRRLAEISQRQEDDIKKLIDDIMKQ